MKKLNLSKADRSIYSKLIIICAVLLAVLVVWQLFLQDLFLGKVRDIHQSNLEYVLDDMVAQLKDAFAYQGNIIEGISSHQDVKSYAADTDTGERYHKAYDTVRPIVEMAAANSHISAVVLYDHTRAWYQFLGGVSIEGLRLLRETGWDAGITRNFVMELDGQAYLCATAPIVQFQNNSRFVKVGMAAVLSSIEGFRESLATFETLSDGVILIHDGSKVLLSNRPQMESMRMADVSLDESRNYILHEDVLTDIIKVTVLLPKDSIFPTRSALTLILLGAGGFVFVLFMFAIGWTNRWLVKPYRKLMRRIDSLNEENPEARLKLTGVAHMDPLVENINRMLARIEEATRREIEAQQGAYETRLERQRIEMVLLHKQIDTHFFYNSLVSIKYLSDRGEAEKAGEVAQGVAALLRYAHSTAQRIPIFEEMSMVQKYTQIMNIRFNGKYLVDFDVDDRLTDYIMLRMLLQPLVENAMVHGLESKDGPCQLNIKGCLMENRVVLSVWDNGIGIGGEDLRTIRRKLTQTDYEYLNIKGISLINIHKRIRTEFGEDYGLEIESVLGEYTQVTISFPAIENR